MHQQLQKNQRVVESPESIDQKKPDADDTDISPMWVLTPKVGELQEIEIDGTPLEEFATNKEVPPDEPVAEVVYESALDSYAPGWDNNTDRLAEFIDEYQEQWHVEIQTYYFPLSRLDPLQ